MLICGRCCFFKQKTAYEMRISDWSSDVCSSDLLAKGDQDSQKFILARLGGWTTKVEVGDKARQPFGGEPVDLSRLSDAELAEYGRLAAIAEGQDPDDGQSDD